MSATQKTEIRDAEKPVTEFFTKAHIYPLVAYALIKFRLVPQDCKDHMSIYTMSMYLTSPKIGKGEPRISFFSRAQSLEGPIQEVELLKEIAKNFGIDETLVVPVQLVASLKNLCLSSLISKSGIKDIPALFTQDEKDRQYIQNIKATMHKKTTLRQCTSTNYFLHQVNDFDLKKTKWDSAKKIVAYMIHSLRTTQRAQYLPACKVIAHLCEHHALEALLDKDNVQFSQLPPAEYWKLMRFLSPPATLECAPKV